jgi:hypothetical protein
MMPTKNPLPRKMVIPADAQDLVDAMLVGLRAKAQVGDITVHPMVDDKPMTGFKSYVVCARNDKDELVPLSGVDASPYRDPAKLAAAQAKKLAKKQEKQEKKAAEKAAAQATKSSEPNTKVSKKA